MELDTNCSCKAKAVRHLKRAIEITPTDPIAHGGLGAVLSDMKRFY